MNVLALCLLIMLARGEEAPAPAVAPTRCIVHYDGQHRVCGELRSRDKDAVHVTDQDGTTHTIPMQRVVAIEPLLELPTPTEGVVELIDGRQLRGLLKRDGCDAVEIMLHGVPIKLERERVARVWILAPLEQRYAELKRSMTVDRPRAHLALCRWLVSERAWELAVPELEAHVGAHRSAEAIKLLRLARAHRELGRQQAASPPTGRDSTPTSMTTDPVPVDEAAVNLIRVYEVDLSDPPPMRIDDDTRLAFLEAYRTSTLLPQTDEGRAALLAAEPVDMLRLMFAHRAREFYGRVQVLQEPEALRQFRQSVHDLWLVPRCGTTDCHGGTGGGRFRLLRARRMDDRLRTSNLLILDALALDGHSMIDWNEPMQSTLIQYALPVDKASRPHPPVAGWRAALESPKSRTTLATARWIESMMRSPRPEYPVEPPVQLLSETRETTRLPR
jgi:hypothetical protein